MASLSKDMTMEYDCQFRITLQDCHLVTLGAAKY